jgi:hypothetical protein
MKSPFSKTKTQGEPMFARIITLAIALTLAACADDPVAQPQRKAFDPIVTANPEYKTIGIQMDGVGGIAQSRSAAALAAALAPAAAADSAAWLISSCIGNYYEHSIYAGNIDDRSGDIAGGRLDTTLVDVQVGQPCFLGALDGSLDARFFGLSGDIVGTSQAPIEFVEYCSDETSYTSVSYVDGLGATQTLDVHDLWRTQGFGFRVTNPNNAGHMLEDYGDGFPECDRTPHAVTGVVGFQFNITQVADLANVWVKVQTKYDPSIDDVPVYNPTATAVAENGNWGVVLDEFHVLSGRSFWVSVTTTSPNPFPTLVYGQNARLFGRNLATGATYTAFDSTCVLDDDSSATSEYYIHFVSQIDDAGNFDTCSSPGETTIGQPLTVATDL